MNRTAKEIRADAWVQYSAALSMSGPIPYEAFVRIGNLGVCLGVRHTNYEAQRTIPRTDLRNVKTYYKILGETWRDILQDLSRHVG